MKRSTKTSLSAGTMALLLGLSSFINGLQSAKGGSCELRVDYAHLSTYAKETAGLYKLKIKAITQCNKPQKYSTIAMKFYESLNSDKKLVKSLDPVTVLADKREPRNAYFESFEVFCLTKSRHSYFGEASGQVHMSSGKVIKVSGKSGKSTSIPCGITAE
jgi:hypothetical protein